MEVARMDERSLAGQAQHLMEIRQAEQPELDKIRRYWRGKQDPPAVVPSTVPRQVRDLLRMSRVNICKLIVDSLAQSLVMEGFRLGDGRDESNAAVWSAWIRNGMQTRQTGVYRAALAYGTAYTVVTPGDAGPVIRGVSPRHMTAVYGEDPDWPVAALERDSADTWRLYDDRYVTFLSGDAGGRLTVSEPREHGIEVHGRPVCPVVRYQDEEDLDLDDDVEPCIMTGQVAPMMDLQDQIDFTTFGLLVKQHYQAFKQRYILGWVAKSEEDKLRMGASQTWTFPDHPDDVQIGELTEGDLTGNLDSREATLRHAASLSQTPAHELVGELVNLSAEALAAAEAGRDRNVDLHKLGFGVSNERTLQAAASVMDLQIPEDAAGVWRDTSARSFPALVDALGKASQMLAIPPEELWERLPGVTLQDVARWRDAYERGDVFARLEETLQAAPAEAA